MGLSILVTCDRGIIEAQMSKPSKKLTDKLEILKQAYIQKLESTLVDLKSITKKPEQLCAENIYKEIHKISGTSGMYGLSEISKLSNSFELYLNKGMANIEDPMLYSKLEEYIVDLEKILRS